MYDRQALLELIQEKALEFGDFTLASGKKASFYLDCRQVTLDARGAFMIGEGILEHLGDKLPQAIGGMAIGADPITAAVITLAGQRNLPLSGFIVRKEAKAHGKARQVEGPVKTGDSVVIVEDVVTTGGSALKAIEAVEAAGLTVREVVAIVDRLEGGRQAFEDAGYRLTTLFDVRDLGVNV